MLSYHYAAFGLTISSELRCPELPPAAPMAVPDVVVRLGAVPERLDQVREETADLQIGDDALQLHVPDIARYRSIAGREILVEPLPGAAPEDVRLFLLGSVFGAVSHQRGQVPLHAGAVAVGAHAVAFCGDSGAGKSTLIAALHRRGYPLLSDDTGVLLPDQDGRLFFHPGVPRIRLWRATLEHFNISPAGLVRDISRADKFHLYPGEASRSGPLPLKRIYFLEKAGEGDPTCIEPVPARERIPRLMAHTYRPALARSIGGAASHFHQCARIAQAIPLHRYSRPWALERLEHALDALEADIRQAAP